MTELTDLGRPGTADAVVTSAEVRRWSIPFRVPFVNARGPVSTRSGALLRLGGAAGMFGWGEAAPLDGFSAEGLDEVVVGLEEWAAAAVGCRLHSLPSVVPGAGPTARGAVVTAAVDLMARIERRSVASLLAAPGAPRSFVATNAVVGSTDPGAAAEAARAGAARGHRTIKLKVGQGSVDDDVRVVRAVRAALGARVNIRLDANGGWSETEALRALDRLTPFVIEYIEDPVLGVDALARVRARSAIPIALDEPLRTAAVLHAHLDAAALDVAVIKPTALGGPLHGLALARAARAAGVAAIVTSFLDAAVGRATVLAVAAALPDDGAVGLATGELFADDVAAGQPVVDGRMAVGPEVGLGVEPRWPPSTP